MYLNPQPRLRLSAIGDTSIRIHQQIKGSSRINATKAAPIRLRHAFKINHLVVGLLEDILSPPM